MGSGKTVCINSLIMSMLFNSTPEDVRFIMIDPKRVEFSLYKNVEQLWSPVATKLEQIDNLFEKLVVEMEARYDKLEKESCKNLESYNSVVVNKLPYIVVVIDELADLMLVSGKELEDKIVRLAQLSRAVGIHLVMATQRPVVEIVTGLIKANMPVRVSFRVASKQDSRVILDDVGAESLERPGEKRHLQPIRPRGPHRYRLPGVFRFR
jgi:S-DNA-T family DNA segregation ATPase FtsK/SpoIIIE